MEARDHPAVSSVIHKAVGRRTYKTIALAALVFLLSTQGTRASEDDTPLKGHRVDPNVRITIDVPHAEAGSDSERGAHTITVTGIVPGQRIALPRAADGSCRTDVIVGVDDLSSDKVEFDPDGLHWSQHDIQTAVSTAIDAGTCELVVSKVNAHDRVRKKALKAASPRLLDKIRGDLPAQPDHGSSSAQPAD